MEQTFKALVDQGHANLARVAGVKYANEVFGLAADNAPQDVTEEQAYEAIYNSLSGVLEHLSAPDCYFNAAIL